MVDDPPELHDGDRLQKVLAAVGFGSRRTCEELIEEGRVTVDGEVAILGRRVDPDVAEVAVDGVPVSVRPGLVYYLLNKPKGVVVTASDPQGRPTALDLVPREPRVFSVGRLDADTEGLIIFTNDGDLAHRLAHPSYGVEKEYLVELDGIPTAGQIRQLRTGVMLDDGMTTPARASIVEPRTIKLTIHEGRNRQVRRMCAAVGHHVVRLVRVRIGPVSDRSLAPGGWRLLVPEEVRGLEESVAEVRSRRQPSKRANR
ncbi:MAG: rRNA synthase [Actinomycetota bacterium]|nr:rRNA synthase [Actinomycetota bacterium]